MEIRDLTAEDRPWAERLVCEHFRTPVMVSRGVLHDTCRLPGLVAVRKGARVGLLQFHTRAGAFEVVVLVATDRGQGIGRCLLDAAASVARGHGCRRLWLITTNDNRSAIAFYSALGWHRSAVHRGAMREARRLKPEIPEFASDGTPIEDEIEFQWLLEDE
jgi:ribosomal protein S18 acetylase RimI-like enzyme